MALFEGLTHLLEDAGVIKPASEKEARSVRVNALTTQVVQVIIDDLLRRIPAADPQASSQKIREVTQIDCPSPETLGRNAYKARFVAVAPVATATQMLDHKLMVLVTGGAAHPLAIARFNQQAGSYERFNGLSIAHHFQSLRRKPQRLLVAQANKDGERIGRLAPTAS
jgi:hypothetical protein